MDKKKKSPVFFVKLVKILNKSDWEKKRSMNKQKIFLGYNNDNKTIECTKCKTGNWNELLVAQYKNIYIAQ